MDIKIRGKVRRIEVSYNMLLPCLLLSIFLVTFGLNQISHALFAEKQVISTVSVQLPVDNAVVSVPNEILQFKHFDVSLQFSTEQLAQRINDIVSVASKGASIQGIIGEVSPYMKAEVIGEAFKIDRQGPLPQLIMVLDETRWVWRISAEESGRHHLIFRLHLLTRDNGRENIKIVTLARANVFVQPNSSAWFSHHWGWVALLCILLLAAGWGLKRYVKC